MGEEGIGEGTGEEDGEEGGGVGRWGGGGGVRYRPSIFTHILQYTQL